MFVEEGFRIRFGNGEIIDFYADSAAAKDECMKVLADAVGKDNTGRSWTDLVLARERVAAERVMKVASGGTAAMRHSMNPAVGEKDTRRQPTAGRRMNPAPKSMIF